MGWDQNTGLPLGMVAVVLPRPCGVHSHGWTGALHLHVQRRTDASATKEALRHRLDESRGPTQGSPSCKTDSQQTHQCRCVVSCLQR